MELQWQEGILTWHRPQKIEFQAGPLTCNGSCLTLRRQIFTVGAQTLWSRDLLAHL